MMVLLWATGCRMVHCLAATLRWSETLNFSMSSAPLCQVLAQITAVNHRVPNNFYKKRFRVREFRGPLDQIEKKKNIQPLLRYEIQLLRFEATGFWCRWKNQTHKLVYLMGQHWPSLGLLPSGHQCREFGVIQQVSTELLRSFVKRTWETRLITMFFGAKKKLRKIVWPTVALEKKRDETTGEVLVILSPVFRCKCCSRCCPGLGFCMAWLRLARCTSTKSTAFFVPRFADEHLLRPTCFGWKYIHPYSNLFHPWSFNRIQQKLRMDL